MLLLLLFTIKFLITSCLFYDHFSLLLPSSSYHEKWYCLQYVSMELCHILFTHRRMLRKKALKGFLRQNKPETTFDNIRRYWYLTGKSIQNQSKHWVKSFVRVYDTTAYVAPNSQCHEYLIKKKIMNFFFYCLFI